MKLLGGGVRAPAIRANVSLPKDSCSRISDCWIILVFSLSSALRSAFSSRGGAARIQAPVAAVLDYRPRLVIHHRSLRDTLRRDVERKLHLMILQLCILPDASTA